jgi:hypothetical protein
LSLGDFARNTTHRNTRREYYFYPENPQILDILIQTILIYAILGVDPANIILWKATNYHIPRKNTNIFLYNLKNNDFALNY